MSLKFSIITPSFNQGRFIKDTIESVLNQNYDNFEHIVVDGASTDNTIEILKQYKHIKWISEKDSGPVEAINKGLSMATGEIATWLNSDDYFERNIFKDVVNEFKNEDTKIVVGNMILIDTDKNFLYENNNNAIYNLNYLIRINPDIVKQPSTFFRKDLFYEVGGFDESLRLIWDYDLFLKMFKITKPEFVDKTFAYQRIYDSTLTRTFLRRQAYEAFKVSRRYGARIYDRINIIVLKRFLFPSLYTTNKSLPVRIIRYLKK